MKFNSDMIGERVLEALKFRCPQPSIQHSGRCDGHMEKSGEGEYTCPDGHSLFVRVTSRGEGAGAKSSVIYIDAKWTGR